MPQSMRACHCCAIIRRAEERVVHTHNDNHPQLFGCISVDVLSKLKLLWNVWLVNVSVNLLHDEPVTHVQ